MRPLLVVAVVSATAGVAVAVFGHIGWFGDADTFVDYAKNLADGIWNPALGWRSPGYPLIMLATGVLTGSLLGLIVLQTALGIAMPVIIAGLIAPADQAAALVIGLAAAVSLVPYAYELLIYHSQVFAFALLAIGSALALWWSDGAPRWLYLLSGACTVAAFLRPTGYALAAGALVLALLRRKHVLHIVVAAALFLAATVGFAAYQHRREADAPSPPGLFGPGAQLFFNVYMNQIPLEDDGLIEAGIVANLGRVSIDDALPGFAPPLSASDHRRLFDVYGNNPAELAQAMLAQPTLAYYSVIIMTIADDHLLARVSTRSLLSHPLATADFVARNIVTFMLAPVWRIGGIPLLQGSREVHRYDVGFAPARASKPNLEGTPVAFAARWVEPSPPSRFDDISNRYFRAVYRIIAPLAGLLMLVGALGAALLPDDRRSVPLAVIAVYLIHVATMALLVDPLHRYQLETVPLALAGAGCGIAVIRRLLAQVGRLRPA